MEWLTDELDNTPYFYNKEKLKPPFEDLETKKAKIERYFHVHPKAELAICTDEKRKNRHLYSALSYLELEGFNFDIVPSSDQNSAQLENEYQDMQKIHDYADACEFMHYMAKSPNGFLDDNLLIRAHTMLYAHDKEKRNFVRYRFRNETDREIIIGQGYFQPVPGAQVMRRFVRLIGDFHNAWYHDHTIIKGAKFLVEYVRIQPHLDGNKRTALMALNFILEQGGYPDIYIDKTQANQLFAALKTSMLTRDITDLINLITRNINTRYDKRIDDIKKYRLREFAAREGQLTYIQTSDTETDPN